MSSGNLFIFKNKTEQGNNSSGSQVFYIYMEKKMLGFPISGVPFDRSFDFIRIVFLFFE